MPKKIKAKKVTDIFRKDEIAPISGELQGKTLILDPRCVSPQYQTREFLLWVANGGFGCTEGLRGRAVFAKCVGDGESARWSRNEFVGIFIGKA